MIEGAEVLRILKRLDWIYKGSMADARLDKWLWAARFFKTRSLSTAAITGGKIEVNGESPKASLKVKEGDRIVVKKPPYEFAVTVTGISQKRGPAKEAALLYEETPESLAAREKLALALKEEAASRPKFAKGRPTKRERRRWLKVRRS